MTLQHSFRKTWVAVALGLAAHPFLAACQASGGDKQDPPEQQERLRVMQSQGTQASLTVFPVILGDSAALNKKVADVLALLLEKAGMTNLETTDAIFRLPKESTFDDAAKLFGEFVRQNPIKTDYALYSEFVGNPKTGPKEIRGVIVNSAGQSVLVDRQTQADRDFKRAKPSNPMACCLFLAERIRTRLDIPESARDDSGEGKFAQRFVKESPGPDKAERAAMAKRQAIMKTARRSATVAVFPVRLSDDQVGKTHADQLAELLGNKNLFVAGAVDSPLRVTIKPAHNEQKLLWDLARAFQDHVRKNPPATDYALLADYMMHPSGDRVWAVHFVICDRAGDWVIVDYQNEHHGDFQSVNPKTPDDCGRLVAKRLEGYVR